MNLKTRRLVVTGLLVAIEAILAFTPAGFINIIPVSITTLHLPVIIGAVLEGPVVGGILGLVFGLFSFMTAVFAPATPLAVVFQNPLVSVLPRVLVGIGSALLFKAFAKMSDLEKTKRAYRALGAVIYALFTLVLAWTAYYYLNLFSAGLQPWFRIGISLLTPLAIVVLAAVFFKRFLTGDKRNIGAAVAGVGGALINAAGVLGMMSLIEYQNMVIQIPDIIAKGFGVVLSSIILTNTIPEAILACAVTVFVYKAMRAVKEKRQAKPVETKG